jgi:CheY-like chemotaxis protein
VKKERSAVTASVGSSSLVREDWDRPEEFDHVVLVADDDPVHLASIRERLLAVAGVQRAQSLGRYPRFRVVTAGDGAEALRAATSDVSVAAIDLVMPRHNGIEVIQELRAKRPDIAILAFTAGAAPSLAVAAMMAGADHFHEYRDLDSFERALDLAIDRRQLARLIERSEEQVEAARGQLARLGGHPSQLPGLSPPDSREAVIPFNEAARRYLQAAAKIYAGDPRGLAARLGMSYFAMRRLLKRFGVPFPGRSRTRGTSGH